MFSLFCIMYYYLLVLNCLPFCSSYIRSKQLFCLYLGSTLTCNKMLYFIKNTKIQMISNEKQKQLFLSVLPLQN